MTLKTFLPENIYTYVRDHSVRESDLLRRLREETRTTPEPQMQISPDQGKFFSLLMRLIHAENTIEIGVFTGYSSLCVAQSLPPHGKIIACDVSEEWTSVARRYWAEAGVAHKIDLRLAPAEETLRNLLDEGKYNFFDFIFIDADKERIDIYYELSLLLLRPNGVIAIDNTLWEGKVMDPSVIDPRVSAIRELNIKLISDTRVEVCMLPIADGVTLVLKH